MHTLFSTGSTRRREKSNQRAKHDAGKLRPSLVPTQIIWDIAEVREYGNRKYGDPQSWRQVELERYVDALYRHMLAFIEDHDSVDEESGIPHYKHMACNMAFLCEMLRRANNGGGNKKGSCTIRGHEAGDQAAEGGACKRSSYS